jgi:hypothetical protein
MRSHCPSASQLRLAAPAAPLSLGLEAVDAVVVGVDEVDDPDPDELGQ